MENNNDAIFKNAMTYGLIIGLVYVVADIIFYLTGVNFSVFASVAIYAILIGGISWSQVRFRNDVLGGYAKYGKILQIGILITVFLAVIVAFYKFIMYSFVDKNLINKYYMLAEQKITSSGLQKDMVDKILDDLAKDQEKMTPLKMVWKEFMGTTIFGIIIVLISSIFTRKNKANGFEGAMQEIDNTNQPS